MWRITVRKQGIGNSSRGDNVSVIIFVLGGCEAHESSLDAIIYTEEDTNEDPLLDFLDLSLMKDK